MSTKSTDIIIIGAGLTGLSLAYYLKKAGKQFLLLEQQDRTGGVINTVTENDFTFETGPNTGVLSSPELAGLFEDLQGKCSLDTANTQAKKRYVWKKGKWNALPSGLISAINTPLFSMYDKFRILGEPFRKPGTDCNETIAELVTRRLGKSYLDYAVDPFISGIYAGDPEKLVTRYAMPKLYALEQNYGSFIRGAIKKKGEPKTLLQKKATGEVFSVKGGLKQLILTLNDEIGIDNIRTGCKEIKVLPLDGGFQVSYLNTSGESVDITASRVVTTVGGYALPELLPFLTDDLLKPLANMLYAGVVQVVAGFKNWNGAKLDAFGGLMPTREKHGILGILFPSAIFTDRTPERGGLLSVFLGGVKNPGLINKTDSEIETLVYKEIRETMGTTEKAELLKIFRYKYAIPQYDMSSGERLASIDKIQSTYPGLILAGNIRDGIGMPDRVKQARQLSELFIP
ncbi:MAG: protoporphyrinogen oxidase [Paludibacter sp.]|nr:protoporphyrinogen oxidase [Paludibacter sp.]